MRKVVVLIGPPGSGKSTQRAKMVERYDLAVFSGDDIRAFAKVNTEFQEVYKKGELIFDDVIKKLVEEKIQATGDKEIVFDGFPRNENQINFLEEFTKKYEFEVMSLLVNVSEEEVVERLGKRYVCSICGKVAFEPGKCSKCGEQLEKRLDDKPEVIRKRIKVYREQTEPIISYFKRKGQLVEVDGEGTFDEVTQRIFERLDGYFKE